MRFGTSGRQFTRLLEAATSTEDLAARFAAFDHAATVRELAGYGFDPIELGGDLTLFLPDAFSPSGVERLAALRDELGLTYTVHLPLWSVDASTPLAPVRRGAVQALIDTIQATRSLEPEVYVLHATGPLAAEFGRQRLPDVARSFLLRLFQERARTSVETLLAETGLPSRQLALETIEFPFDLMLELADALDLSVCFDTGHVLVGFSGPIDVFTALDRCLPRLAEVHLHDGPWQGSERRIGYGKDHQPLGAGDLDLARFLDRLDAAGFTGPLVFELSIDEALASLDVIRSVRPHLVPPGPAPRPPAPS